MITCSSKVGIHAHVLYHMGTIQTGLGEPAFIGQFNHSNYAYGYMECIHYYAYKGNL